MLSTNKEIWVFLSHSNEDYEKVRIVRNLLEEMHFRPIMFYLLCLNDEEEVSDLIKREIDARTRFILCDSENAKKSKWVQTEVNYIKRNRRKFQTIDLSKSEEEIALSLKEFKEQVNVFISSPESLAKMATELYERLDLYDLFVECNVISEDNTRDLINVVMRTSQSEKGLLVFLYYDTCSENCKEYLREVVAMGRTILPVNFSKEKDVEIEEILSEGDVIYLDNKVPSVDDIMKLVLDKLFDHKSIHVFANNFRNGKDKNDKEADLCWDVYETKAWNSDAPYARVSLAREYRYGGITKKDLKKAYYCLQYAVYGEHLTHYERDLKELQSLIEEEKSGDKKIEENDVKD